MIYYAIQSLVASGINDILLVCGGNSVGEFLRILGNGEEFGLKHLHYTYQKEASGIAHALGLAEEWANGEPIVVMLSDNILENPFPEAVAEFESNPNGARIFITETQNPECYGVVTLDGDKVVSIIEKPQNPASNSVAIGLYMYDNTVWKFIKDLEPSARGELEITDINNRYLSIKQLTAVPVNGWWRDCGESLDGYMESCIKAYETFKK